MNNKEMQLYGYLTYKLNWRISNVDLDSGMGDFVIKKNGNGYIFYIMEKKDKNDYHEFNNFDELVNFIIDNYMLKEEDKKYLNNLLESQDVNYTMMTDLYELTMSQVYLNKHKENEEAVFDVFFRKNPFDKGYGLMGGLHEIIEFIKNAHFSDEDIDYLRSLNIFDDDLLDYLRNFKFHGDIYAVPDGTPVFANEPILTVKAPIIEAHIVETLLLSYLNAGILYLTASKRITEAAGNTIVNEFGARRALGPEAAVMASTYSYMGGCNATSNVLAGKRNGVKVFGTISHGFITSFKNEYDAFIAWVDLYPKNSFLLVDTYDVLGSGVPNAIKAAQYLRERGYELQGIRIDSGDLAYLSKEAKRMFVEAGFPNVKICLSDGLTESKIKELKEQGAVIDSIGLGDNIVLPDKARVGCVYKESALKQDNEYKARIKVSNDAAKTINPGYKKVYRLYDKDTGYALGDIIALHEENIPIDSFTLVDPNNDTNLTIVDNYEVEPLQKQIFNKGELVYDEPSLEDKRNYCFEQMETLTPEIKAYDNPETYRVVLTEKLQNLKKELLRKAKSMKSDCGKGKKLVKKR